MALPFFCEGLLQNVGTHLGLGIHLLQAPVLFLQRLHLRDHRGVHAAVFGAPFVERGRTDAVCPAQLRHRRAGLSLLENAQNLAVGKSRFLQGNLLGVDYEKIPLLADTVLRGDYQGEEIANDSMSAGCDQAERPVSAFESNMREVIVQPGVRRSILAR